jgi:superfamily II DNA helicase RecQ
MAPPAEFLSLDKYGELNPVRDHIELHFVDMDPDDAVRRIHEELIARMDAERSRAIVFCHSRRATEEAAHAMNALFADVDRLRGKAAHFHAGLEADARTSLVNRFKDGDVLVLFATKAFGMGMDIRNIHFVYHLGPSSTFEDYLQEVGRAGRDHHALERAGASRTASESRHNASPPRVHSERRRTASSETRSAGTISSTPSESSAISSSGSMAQEGAGRRVMLFFPFP